MPKFIKMGLGGTGFLGHQECSRRSALKYAARRKSKTGYPWAEKFQTPEQLHEYFSGDRIECLLCGRSMRTLAVHVKRIHEISPDEYKERFGIPFSYTLSCADTSAIHAEQAFERIEVGDFVATPEQAVVARAGIKRGKQKSPVVAEITQRNLAIMNAGKTGEVAAARRLQSKRGSEEFKEKMRARPQIQDFGERMREYWTGREQTPEHVLKRTGARKKQR